MIVQGSEEWKAIRLGKATASRVADIVAKGKSGPSAMRANYLAQLVAERLTGKPQDSYQSDAMERGSEVEPDARNAYAFRKGVEVEEIGFVPHPTIAMSGASPDGLVGDRGLVQFKCPNTATHIDTLRRGIISGRYQTQMMWELACTERDWCDFASYDPRLPESMTLAVQRVNRDDARIKELEREVTGFLREVEDTVADLTQRYQGGGLRAALVASIEVAA
jgi:putative phage-type endonuclease